MKGWRLADTLSCEVAAIGQGSEAAHMWGSGGAWSDSQQEKEDLHFQNAVVVFFFLPFFPHKCCPVTKVHILIHLPHSACCRVCGKVCVIFQPHWTHVRL